MRIECVILEYHRAATFARFQLIHNPARNRDLTSVNFFEARNHAEQGGFAAPGWAKDHREVAMKDIKVYAVNHLGATIGFDDASNENIGHWCLIYPD